MAVSDAVVPFGLYEEVLSEWRQAQLKHPGRELAAETRELDPAESYAAFANYLRLVTLRALDSMEGDDKLARQLELCNRIVRATREAGAHVATPDATVVSPARLLLSVGERHGSGRSSRPDTALALSCLLTGTRRDPSLVSQIKKELRSADRVDILCSFIKWSGLRMLEEELRAFTARKATRLRIITTSYMGATDLKAVDLLHALPRTEVRVSYDTHRTRLHAKAYMFHRMTGFGSAYVGSANLSHAAMTDGLEWSVKVSQYETPHIWEKVTATFETYWNDEEFVPYSVAERDRLRRALAEERSGDARDVDAPVFDLRPYRFQEEILDRLHAERVYQGRERQLVVAATGTGKTMIAAFDYRRWSREMRQPHGSWPTLLFVAHREEILKQSLRTFRAVCRDHNLGDLLVGGRVPTQEQHLFASIQSYHARGLSRLAADHFDYVVVDEFHHAAAESYGTLLDHVRPKVLLGLTATPERADGLEVLRYFDGHISAEIRLPDAINRRLLCTFQYFGISDEVDLSDVRWKRGGYDRDALDAKYTGNAIRAGLVVDKVRSLLLDVRRARGIGFCVSIKHAEFMAAWFNHAGIPAQALSANSSTEDRRAAQHRLARGEINFTFVVDLYNEGVDIPEVDTVLFLRPTESLTVFLQQLGRGLRLYEGKDCLTVLDFVGQAHRNYRWDLRYRALLEEPSSLIDQLENGFSHLPAGCSLHLERQARAYVLDNVKRALKQSKHTLIDELKTFAEGLGRRPGLEEFLRFFGLETEDIYRKRMSWSRLQAHAGLIDAFDDPDETALTKGLRRLQHICSAEQIGHLLAALRDKGTGTGMGTVSEVRLLTMLHASLWPAAHRPTNLAEAGARLQANPHHCRELMELLEHRLGRIASVPPPLALPFECALTLHALYTRDEVLAALGRWTLEHQPQFREGVLHLKELRADAFFITLDKTDRDYSPTTMYRDYALNERLFHWQSQSTTSVESPTGQRYIHHAERGHTILLFVREHKRVGSGLSAPYYFLGPAHYESHEGSRPINFVWRLDHPMPASIVRQTARLGVA